MNEASKLTIATSLVAVGLGLAYLCGPPTGAPQVITSSASPAALHSQAVPTIAAIAPLRLHADAPPSAEILAGGSRIDGDLMGGANSEGVVLSAAETESNNAAPQPHWLAPASAVDDNSLPPRRVDADDQAAPLPAVTLPLKSANTNDDWLLRPPAMPDSFDSKPAASGSASSLASETTSRAGDTVDDAWWTRDTQPLQGLNGTAPDDPRNVMPPRAELNRSSGKLVQPSAANARLTIPIDLGATSASPAVQPINRAATGAPPPAALDIAPPPVVAARMHLIADGDTLDRLAERYLQDPARAREIFELNQDVLRDPNLLPIGKPLRIPGEAAQSESELDLEDSTGRMVPVEATPRTAVIQPQAQLQTPEPIALREW